MELTVASIVNTNSTKIPIFTEQEVLFRRSESWSPSESRRRSFSFSWTSHSSTVPAQICEVICPSTLTFSLKIPTTFLHDDIPYNLPPTYTARINTIPGQSTQKYIFFVDLSMAGIRFVIALSRAYLWSYNFSRLHLQFFHRYFWC